ncbi:hypothetical protein V865_001592 [Kwoniella europaea PYCC6329]|uniref:Ketoreductase (KR) domain-containing protein n=1 Tax=Kwoniella europaea PYCC6329 TaxID=1423913 RepID=A0AAX4KC78_9TREE
MTLWTFLGRQWTILPSAPRGPYLKGKVVLMTGANSGIGLESLKHFARASPSKLILCVRSLQPTEEILTKLQSLHPDLQAEIIHLDLCDLATIKILPDELKKRGLNKIDVVINNAGAHPGNADKPPTFTKDGYEQTPGLAVTNLGRDFKFSLSFVLFGAPFLFLNARSAEKGARNVSSAVAQADQSYDYWAECGPSYSESSWLTSGTGIKATKALYQEMIDEVEKISPGVTKGLIV